MNSNGSFTYNPTLNMIGTDTFSIKANNGDLQDKVVKFNLSITGKNLVLVDGSRTYFDGTLASSCNAYRTQNNGNYKYSGETGSGFYKISILPSGNQVVYCDMDTDGGGWTLFARFDGDDVVSSHLGSSDYGILNSSTAIYSFKANKIGTVSKVMAKSPAGVKSWILSSPQALNIPTSGNFQAAFSDRGTDNCSGMAMHFDDSGCWGGRKAGPAVGVTIASYSPTCGGTGNWESFTYFYGRGASLNTTTCVPVGKWNQTSSQAIYSPAQEWYIR